MRRNVAEAIKVVRQTFAGPFADRPGPAWEYARTLADEVERLHARVGRLEAAHGSAAEMEDKLCEQLHRENGPMVTFSRWHLEAMINKLSKALVQSK